MSTENHNWTFNFDVRDVNAATTKPAIAPEGYYVGTIERCFINNDWNANKVNFYVRITEGQFAGCSCRDSMMLPGSTEKDNRAYWRALFESMGLNGQQLGSQTINGGGEVFVNKSVQFYWKPGNKEIGTWNKIAYLSSAAFEREKATFKPTVEKDVAITAPVLPQAAPQAASIPPMPPAPAGTVPTATAGFASANVSSSDLLSMLNK
jgi:hypothetical protein